MRHPFFRLFFSLSCALSLGSSLSGCWLLNTAPKDEKVISKTQESSSFAQFESSSGHVLVLGPRVVIKTAKGEITLQTFPDEAPLSFEHWMKLIKTNFYTGQKIHRVEKDSLIQFGDPRSKKMTFPLTKPFYFNGGSGESLPPEFIGQTIPHLRGAVGFARTKKADSADAQIYLTLKEMTHLNGAFTLIARVDKGFEVLSKLQLGDSILSMDLLPAVDPAKTEVKK
jgi:cyclophilin family peptidyl-prolyl cis-trans isomerase